MAEILELPKPPESFKTKFERAKLQRILELLPNKPESLHYDEIVACTNVMRIADRGN